MSFRFNFFEDGDHRDATKDEQTSNLKIQEPRVPCEWVGAADAGVVSQSTKTFQLPELGLIAVSGNALTGLPNSKADTVASVEQQVSEAIKVTDIEPGVYEGGLKVWECTIDLVGYLRSTSFRSTLSQCKSLLELGCGHGIPGIAWLKERVHQPDSHATFQDLNKSVLLTTAIPNVTLNLGQEALQTCKFLSGDWQGVNDFVPKHSCDLIITSETVYCTDNYPVLVELLRHCLVPGGHALIAGKRYYFGVGGGIDTFADYVSHATGFECKLVASFDNGFSNIRDILHITKSA